MNSVGIDVSMGHSTVKILQPDEIVVKGPFEVKHTKAALRELAAEIKRLPGETKVVIEHTGRYYESVAETLYNSGITVCCINPKLIKDFTDNHLRPVKTDNSDAHKIARYGLLYWNVLSAYNPVDEKRYILKLLNRQSSLNTKMLRACENNLISLVEECFSGVKSLFTSPVRADGSLKWVDFIETFWHSEIISNMSCKAFVKRYEKWCHKKHYIFNRAKAEFIHKFARNTVTIIPKNEAVRKMIQSAVAQLKVLLVEGQLLKTEMLKLASEMPEFKVVNDMRGVGNILGPQLIAEIGDVTKYDDKKSLVAFAGINPGVNQSGKFNQKSNRISKRGSPHLRRTLFLVMTALIQRMPAEDPVYAFIDRKRAEGKAYLVYMTAAANKFLRIYYARVIEYLRSAQIEKSDATNITPPQNLDDRSGRSSALPYPVNE